MLIVQCNYIVRYLSCNVDVCTLKAKISNRSICMHQVQEITLEIFLKLRMIEVYRCMHAKSNNIHLDYITCLTRNMS